MNSTRIVILIVSIALLLASLVALARPAQAGSPVFQRFPVSGSFFNPCTHENVNFTGKVLVAVDPAADNRGFEFHSVDTITGVGETTGRHYVSLFNITISLQGTEATSDGGAFAETNVILTRLIAPGPGNDLVSRIIFHFTINATGETVGLHLDRIEEECV